MENNFAYSSYPDSSNSSPRSREIDDAQSWDDQQQPPPPPPASSVPHNHKVKLMCSYGGKIQPRPHDNQLSYTGGETKILSVDRTIKYSSFVSKLVSLCGGGGESDICFKYQLPGEDLDALISVTNDEDLEHMMLEYDRLHRGPGKQSARLRLFLFRMNNPLSFPRNEVKSERQWFVDALNSTQMPILEGSPTPAPPSVIPDFLFGFDKQPPPPVAEVVAADPSAGSEGRLVIMDSQSLKTGGVSHEEVMGVKKDEVYFAQKIPERVDYLPAVNVPQQMPVSAGYLTERHMISGGYQEQHQQPPSPHQPIYLVVPPTLPPVTGQYGQGYYGVQRAGQEVYNAVPHGYVQVGYDSAGRAVYMAAAPYATSAAPMTAVVDGRQVGGEVKQDGKIVAGGNHGTKAPQTSFV